MAMKVDRDKCIGCEACTMVCPVGAISMVDGKAMIDPEQCISCGACVGECPVEAIAPEATAKAEVAKLDAELAKAAEKRAAKKAENAPLVEALQAILTDEPMTASQIAERVEGTRPFARASA